MSGQSGEQTSTKSPESMGMVGVDMELSSELAVDGLNDLANSVEHLAHWLFLIAFGKGQ